VASNITFGEEPVVKTAKKIHDQKLHELTGNNIFEGDAAPSSGEKAAGVRPSSER
ncbi:hypothetical protein HPP92_004290, partial [Vanilla planifolia]